MTSSTKRTLVFAGLLLTAAGPISCDDHVTDPDRKKARQSSNPNEWICDCTDQGKAKADTFKCDANLTGFCIRKGDSQDCKDLTKRCQ